jgi:hypothetical protein
MNRHDPRALLHEWCCAQVRASLILESIAPFVKSATPIPSAFECGLVGADVRPD